jgi:hypothetical protein
MLGGMLDRFLLPPAAEPAANDNLRLFPPRADPAGTLRVVRRHLAVLRQEHARPCGCVLDRQHGTP